MKIALVGGHMAPALGLLAVIPNGAEVIYIGREHVFEGDEGTSLEQQVLVQKGIRFIPLQAGRIQRTLTTHTIASFLKIPKGLMDAISILRKEKPDIIVGFGGYLSVPVGIAASILRIPLVIHESTLEAGLANKFLATIAQKVCISWDSSRAYFPKEKTVVTGNPLLPFDTSIQKELLPESKEKLPLVVVSGGSGGSHSVNTYILHILPELLDSVRIIHQTGDAKEFDDYKILVAKRKTLPKKLQQRYLVTKFIDPENINAIFGKADLVIGRSGINTITTLLLLHKKALLIPLSTGQKNEQLKNARLLESEGLAVILDQKTLSPKILFQEIKKMLAQKTTKDVPWHIPVIKSGAENLLKVVLQCMSPTHHQEK